MFAKKTLGSPISSRPYKKELEYLHARKSALDTLIQSLEEYGRFRAIPVGGPGRKTA